MQSALVAVEQVLLKLLVAVAAVAQVDILLVGLLFPTQSQLELVELEHQLPLQVLTALLHFMEWFLLAVVQVD
jgi:hypothetical protein